MEKQVKMKKLYQAILSLENEEACAQFLEDIMTPKELEDMGDRLEVAQLLYAGETYGKITEKTGMSSTTIARINRTLHHGTGGYKKVLEKKQYKD